MEQARAYCTYFDSGYLSRGLALIDSLREHNDESPVWVLALDDAAKHYLDDAALPGVFTLTIADLESAEPELPPLKAADLIAGHASAAMDVSDGLLGDLASLAAASGLVAQIELDRVPFAGGAESLVEMLDLATWGDDYQLLFAAPHQSSDFIENFGIRVTRIGQMAEGAGLTATVCGKPVNLPETLAFEHGRVGQPPVRS